MEPRPPKTPRSSTPPQRPTRQQPWDGGGQTPPGESRAGQQPSGPAAGGPQGARPPAARPGYGQPGYPPAAPYGQPAPGYDPGATQQYPQQQPGYGQQPGQPGQSGQPRYPGSYGQPSQPSQPGGYPYPSDAGYPGYGQQPGQGSQGYGQGGYGYGQQPPAGSAYPGNAGYGNAAYGQPGYPNAQPPYGGRSSGQGAAQGGWMNPLPDEEFVQGAPVGPYPSSGYGDGGYGDAGYADAGFGGGATPRAPRSGPVVNRQTQVIAALAVGGLALMVIAIVVGFVIFGGDDTKKPNSAAAVNPTTAPTVSAPAAATAGATITMDAGPGVATGSEAAQATAGAGNAPAAGTGSGQAAATQPPATGAAQAPATTAAANAPATGALYTNSVKDLLPAAGDLPAGFVQTFEDQFQRADVAASLGNEAQIEQNLRDWRWAENWQRQFEIPTQSISGDQETIVLFVSIHRFRSIEGAQQAFPFFVSKAQELSDLKPTDAQTLGDESVALVGGDAGSNIVTLYIRKGNLLFRVYGFSKSGAPLQDTVALSEKILAKME